MTTAAGSLTRVAPAIYVGKGQRLLAAEDGNLVVDVVVDLHLHLPDMFTITFRDPHGDVVARTGLLIGTPVAIAGASPMSPTVPYTLMAGEVTAIEGTFDERCHTVIRGYSKDHRLQRAARTRTFVNMTDSDIARKIATDAGLLIGTIESTRTTHDHLGQLNETDWEFLSARAALIGFEFGIADDKFFFRKASGTTGLGRPVELTYPSTLQSFHPRITAGNLASETEVRVWDPVAAKLTSAKKPTATTSVTLASATPAEAAGVFDSKQMPAAVAAANPALGDLGPPPSDHGHVFSDRGLAIGGATGAASDEALAGALEHVASTFAEAHGICMGDPHLAAGAAVKIAGVSTVFCGTWALTRTQHVFDVDGYHTHFEVSGRHERSLLGLATGAAAGPTSRVPGLVCAIVSNIADPQHKGRVKLTMPWLSPQYESDWAPVVQPGGGKRSGGMFMPEVGDEVLAGFEFGDPYRPYVLGGVVNNNSAYDLGGAPVKGQGGSAGIAWRGLVSSSGNRLAFHDELPPGEGGGPPQASEIVLGTKTASLALAIDQVAGTVALTCKPAPPDSKSAKGQLTIECGDAGVIDIKTGPGGTVNIDGGAQLNLKAQAAVKIESSGVVEIKGNPIKLN
ncbi:phage baseplate assembly protein V [Labedaea rhizosphaerae]|uniref:Uncharacterized protein involved in type VI secretion and phage assembly n=1 Tax=Labedaea rhizosphaerae TaxID=598644 RepID=A0A4R6SHQ3_LABRH|nr:phage baseplate assembly protein V [Labedaea rhizosphaerae]TDQ01147.1 uncharacterized protein involved in type VI secretion and phage assembly [Labedaea rhizosphaerae]